MQLGQITSISFPTHTEQRNSINASQNHLSCLIFHVRTNHLKYLLSLIRSANNSLGNSGLVQRLSTSGTRRPLGQASLALRTIFCATLNYLYYLRVYVSLCWLMSWIRIFTLSYMQFILENSGPWERKRSRDFTCFRVFSTYEYGKWFSECRQPLSMYVHLAVAWIVGFQYYPVLRAYLS
jgi:hypothetical protein